MSDFLCWLNANSGILTLLTVVATFITCWCNFASARATRAQVEEMRRQYNEENRPYIGAELTYVRRTFYGIKFINMGSSRRITLKFILTKTLLTVFQRQYIKHFSESKKDESALSV